ncbi:hypothetical protein VUR80DRAFT_3792 [Thermomyces stellatus]
MSPGPSPLGARRAGRRAFTTLPACIRIGFACPSLAAAAFLHVKQECAFARRGVIEMQDGILSVISAAPCMGSARWTEVTRQRVQDFQGTFSRSRHALRALAQTRSAPVFPHNARYERALGIDPTLRDARTVSLSPHCRVLSHLAMSQSVGTCRASGSRPRLPAEPRHIRTRAKNWAAPVQSKSRGPGPTGVL